MNKITSYFVYAASIVSFSAQAENFFQSCSVALKLPSFRVLREYLESNPDKPSPDDCFRLNNYQFLLTITDTGRLGQGLYTYDFNANTFGLSDLRPIPGIKIEKEFEGMNHKRFVLMSWSNAHQGNWTQGFNIIQLTPTREDKSYVNYLLLATGQDPESGLCGHWETTDPKTGKTEKHQNIMKGKTAAISSYRILNEDTEHVSIVFNITEENCETSEFKTYTKTFRLNDGLFKEGA